MNVDEKNDNSQEHCTTLSHSFPVGKEYYSEERANGFFSPVCKA